MLEVEKYHIIFGRFEQKLIWNSILEWLTENSWKFIWTEGHRSDRRCNQRVAGLTDKPSGEAKRFWNAKFYLYGQMISVISMCISQIQKPGVDLDILSIRHSYRHTWPRWQFVCALFVVTQVVKPDAKIHAWVSISPSVHDTTGECPSVRWVHRR